MTTTAPEVSTLRLLHLEALQRLKKWQTASSPSNAPAEHPGTLCDLFDAKLIDRDARHTIVLTSKGETAVQEALAAFVAFAR